MRLHLDSERMGEGMGEDRVWGVFLDMSSYACLNTDKEVESPQYDLAMFRSPGINNPQTVRLHTGHTHTHTHASVYLYCSYMCVTKEV